MSTPEVRQAIYNRIISGFGISTYEGIVYYVYDPCYHETYITDSYYESILEEYIEGGTPTEEQLMLTLREKGLWSDDSESKLADLEENKKKILKELQNAQFKSNTKKNLQAYLDKTNFEIKKLNSIRNSVLSSSAEYLAKMARYRRMVFLLARFEDNERVWTKWDSFVKNADVKLVDYLVYETYFSDKVTETGIRDLARNEPWRSVWVTANKTGNLFGRPTVGLTDYQRALVSWSLVYSAVFESPDCPSDEVINDDQQLDAWLNAQSEKRKTNKQSAPAGKGNEVFVFAETEEDAAKVYNLNDAVTKKRLQTREKVLAEKGEVREQDMPDVKKQIQTMQQQAAMKRFNNGK